MRSDILGFAPPVVLPVTDVRVGQADADAWWFRHWFGPRRRLAWAVLDLPAADEHYLVGRPRQALRTNLRHARALGVTSSRVTYETWFEAVSAVMRALDYRPSCNPPSRAGRLFFGQALVLLGQGRTNRDAHPQGTWMCAR